MTSLSLSLLSFLFFHFFHLSIYLSYPALTEKEDKMKRKGGLRNIFNRKIDELGNKNAENALHFFTSLLTLKLFSQRRNISSRRRTFE